MSSPMVAHARTKTGNAAGNYGDERQHRSRPTRLAALKMVKSCVDCGAGNVFDLAIVFQRLEKGQLKVKLQ